MKKIIEQRVVKKTRKMMLAHTQAGVGVGQQSMSKGRRYRVRVRSLAPITEADGKGKKKIVIDFEPENKSFGI